MTSSLSKARTVNLAFTGASGALYGLRLLQCLVAAGCRVNVMISKAAQIVIATETDLKLPGTPPAMQKTLSEYASAEPGQVLVFGREDAGLTNEELALADVLTGVPMVADYPSLNLGQSVMVYCYQLASLMQQSAPAAAAADHHQLQALRLRTMALLSRLGVEDDAKLADWLSQRLGLLQQRDTAMLHRLLHDIEKNLPE